MAFNGKTKYYSYVPGTSNLSGYNVAESGNSVMNTSYSYDAHKRLTGITANVNGVTYTHGYTLNDKNQRTGIILADGKNWNFSYDNMGQVTGAMLNNSASLLNTYSYNYDLIGNRIQATKDNDITSYNSNIVNQYTQINSAVPTYDQDGNMLTNGAWSYTWNGENRMTVAQNAARKVEFSYDYMGRCFERKEYTASNDSWNLDKTVYIVYDDYKQIAEYENEELYQQYAWDSVGLDTVAFMSKGNSVYMYWTDGNKNVLKLFDTAGEQASYSYDPFGKVTTAEGSLAADNPFRFSCEYHNDITGLVEYIYRKYDPSLGRWINRDPVEEQGGMNLYVNSLNSVVFIIDGLGLKNYKIGFDDPKIKHDIGSGRWGSVNPQFLYRALRTLVLAKPTSITFPDAFAHLQHYLGNTGSTYTIRLDKMISSSRNVRSLMAQELKEAKSFIETNLKKDGIYNITSSSPSSGYVHYTDSPNWFYAVGGYSLWGKGTVIVKNKGRCFELHMIAKFEDKYNWDTGKTAWVGFINVSDEFMGEFHRQGLAKEFLMVGEWSIPENFKWSYIDKSLQFNYRGGRYDKKNIHVIFLFGILCYKLYHVKQKHNNT